MGPYGEHKPITGGVLEALLPVGSRGFAPGREQRPPEADIILK